MQRLIEQQRQAIARLCERYHVARLEVFGSAAGGAFDEAASDVDFLVEFKAMDPIAYADAYFGLADALESLLSRKVDLVTAPSVRNPYFQRGIDLTRQPLYAA